MAGRRILVVEDDDSSLDLLSSALRGEGFVVRGATDARKAESELATFRPDLALLDVSLGDGIDGYTLARRLRSETDLPLMFLTAASDVEDRVNGFRVGADDYVVKPFSFQELVARIHAVLRRSGRAYHRVSEVDDIVLDSDAHTVRRGGVDVPLTAVEFEMLEALMARVGMTMSKQQLLADVWHFDHFDVNLVEVYISSVRKKLEAHGPRVIHTVRGVGYVMRPAS